MIETDALHQPFEVEDLDRAGVLELFDDAERLDRPDHVQYLVTTTSSIIIPTS